MGRSPFFTLSQVERPQPTDASDALKNLKVGELVQFSFARYTAEGDTPRVFRSISTYSYVPSVVSSNITYKITSIDAIPAFDEIGLRAISLIDVNHYDPMNHMDGWYITTDGYVRECEHFGIKCIVTSLSVK